MIKLEVKKMIDPLEDVLSKNDVCSLLGISPGTLQRMCVKREIPFFPDRPPKGYSLSTQ
jgi:hypothetical protein